MTGSLPQRSGRYVGQRTDSTRWDRFDARDGDVIVCTPPKCGTTWTQAICLMLVRGEPNIEGSLDDLSPWFDSKLIALDDCVTSLEAQSRRRVLKTHTPLDGIPYHSCCNYLAVYRDPRDVYFSIRTHLANMMDTPVLPMMSSDPSEGFRAWIDESFIPGASEQRSLAALAQHFEGFWRFRHLPNVHLLHFSDYKLDLEGSVGKIASLLGIPVNESIVAEIAASTSFESMSANPATYTPVFDKGIWRNDEGFFNKGESGQWKSVLSERELERYGRRLQALVAEEAICWLENGTGK